MEALSSLVNVLVRHTVMYMSHISNVTYCSKISVNVDITADNVLLLFSDLSSEAAVNWRVVHRWAPASNHLSAALLTLETTDV